MAFFTQLEKNLQQTFKKLKGQHQLTEKNLATVLPDIEHALIEADCAIETAMDLTQKIKARALGTEVKGQLHPDQVFKRVVHDELVTLLKHNIPPDQLLTLSQKPPAVILLAGLQGAGKTTTAARLGHWIKHTLGKSVMVVSTDVYRPAAMDQLQTIASQAALSVYPADPTDKPLNITKKAIKAAEKSHTDILIIDTAGRLHIDKDMMSEIKAIYKESNPCETLFVVDSMTGQDAAHSAKAFHEALPKMTGIIVTKTDGDSRGGAILSIASITEQPIKFIGTGEKINDLDYFNADRIAGKILGMGDLVAFTREIESSVDQERIEKSMTNMQKGVFTMDDLAMQLEQAQTMDIQALMQHMPGASASSMPDVDKKKLAHQLAIIRAMTPKERRLPEQMRGSQKRRIAKGSGTNLPMVLSVIKLYKNMIKMNKKMKSTSFKKKLAHMQDNLPSDLF